MSKINNELYLGKYSLKDLAKTYKTPLYVYDEVQIIENIKKYKQYFKSDILDCQIAYASKAFLAPKLTKIINQEGLYIDSVSYTDLYILQKSNFPMSRVLLHGNNKSILELETAIDLQVGYIVVDNINELNLLNDIAREKNKQVKTLFRFNPGISTSTHAYIQTSALGSKFGESIYDKDVIKNIMKVYMTSKHLRLLGFHAHIGSQIVNEESYYLLVEAMLEFADRIYQEYHIPITVLNFGGGFGIKYLESDKEINLKSVLTNMVNLVEKKISEHNLTIKKIMIEPGRSIVGNAGMTLYTIGGIKTTYNKKNYVFVDGGMTDNIRPALYDAKYSHDVVTQVDFDEQIICDIVGKCCESGDIIALDTQMSKVNQGDILVVYTTGAYGYSMSSNYNGLLRPAVIFVNQDKITEVIRREEPEDLVATYNFEGE